MKEAQAHDTFYPHIHPHAAVSAAQDFALTVIFLSGALAIGRLSIALLKRVLGDRDSVNER